MAGGIVLFCPEHRGCLKYPVIDSHHGLFIKLGTLAQLCFFIEVIQTEHIGTALRASGHDFGRMDLRKALAEQIVPESSYDPFLYLKLCPLPDISQ